MSFLRIRSRNKYPRVITDLAEDYLAKLTRCEGRVIIDRGEPGFDCKISCDPEKLKEWVTSQITIDLRADRESQVSRAALLLWLADAQSSDSAETALPQIFRVAQKPYLAELSVDPIATVHCYRCDAQCDEILFEPFSELAVDDIQRTTVWTCPEGHLLFHG